MIFECTAIHWFGFGYLKKWLITDQMIKGKHIARFTNTLYNTVFGNNGISFPQSAYLFTNWFPFYISICLQRYHIRNTLYWLCSGKTLLNLWVMQQELTVGITWTCCCCAPRKLSREQKWISSTILRVSKVLT